MEQKEKLIILKQNMLKSVEKETITLENIQNKFNNFKNFQGKNYDMDINDNHNLLSNNNDIEHNEYKVCTSQIKNLEDVADYRNKKFKNIYDQTKLVENITKDLNILTKSHLEKLETIDDSIVKVKDNSQQSYKIVINASEEDNKFKDNKCRIMILLIFTILLVIVIFKNFNK